MVMTHKSKGKFQPKWDGLNVVEMVYSNRAYHLTNSNSDTLMMPINRKISEKVLSLIMFNIASQIEDSP